MNKEQISELIKKLGSKDAKERCEAAEALGDTAFGGSNIFSAIPALIKALSDEDEFVRISAAEALEKAAEKGTDISAALPYLERALYADADDLTSKTTHAAAALSQHYINKKEFEEINKLLLTEDEPIVSGVTSTLCEAAKNGADISFSIPTLAERLTSWDEYVRASVSSVLRVAADKGMDITAAINPMIKKMGEFYRADSSASDLSGPLISAAANEKTRELTITALTGALSDPDMPTRIIAANVLEGIALVGIDISSAVPALTKALGDEDVRPNAVTALGAYHLNKKNWKDFSDYLLKNESVGVRQHLARILIKAAEKGVDISPTIPALIIALDDKNTFVRAYVAKALGKAAEKGADISSAMPALAKALEDENKEVRETAKEALEKIKKQKSM
jgi:HEAT repeat protein